MKKKYIILLLELGALIFLTLAISYFKLDIKVQQHFYRANSSSVWYQKDNPFWHFGYHYGTLPAILLAVVASIGFILSWVQAKLQPMRRYFLLIILTLIIGPGLVVNAILKDHWGRPRPRQVQEFGGNWKFKEIWERGTPGKGKSFPCGHCSMGFFFITLYYCFKQKHKILAYATSAFSIALGMFIGFARIAQGGHFLSDVLWAWGLTFLTATILYYFVLKIPDDELQSDSSHTTESPFALSRKKRIIVTVAIVASIALAIVIFLFSKPFYRESFHKISRDKIPRTIQLHLELSRGDVFIHSGTFDPPVTIKTIAQGFGFPKYQYQSRLATNVASDTLQAIYQFTIKGLFNEIDVQTIIDVDSSQCIYLSGAVPTGKVFLDRTRSANLLISSELLGQSNEVELNKK